MLATSRWVVALCAAVGIIVGAIAAPFVTPHPTRYTASATVALLPAPNLSISEASGFWEVLNGGQINRTAAIVYSDKARWLPAAASKAGVAESDLSLSAGAVPESSLISVTMQGPTAAATETALQTVLDEANPQVVQVSTPFAIKTIGSTKGSAQVIAGPSALQLVLLGALIGGIIGVGVGVLVMRRARKMDRPGVDGPVTTEQGGADGTTSADSLAESAHSPGEIVDSEVAKYDESTGEQPSEVTNGNDVNVESPDVEDIGVERSKVEADAEEPSDSAAEGAPTNVTVSRSVEDAEHDGEEAGGSSVDDVSVHDSDPVSRT